MPTLLALDAALERVRSGLESRSRRISGRVGERLAEQMSRPGKMLRARFFLLLGARQLLPNLGPGRAPARRQAP